MRLEHGGKYTCGPTTGISDSVMVHVIAGTYNPYLGWLKKVAFITLGSDPINSWV